MPFKPGQSGNPKGRPPKERAWTKFLESAGATTFTKIGDGKSISRKKFLAQNVLAAVTDGKITFSDGRELAVQDFKEWVEIAKWLYTHLDGPLKQQLEHTGADGSEIVIKVVYDDADSNPA